MSKNITNRGMQRLTFIDSLYQSLRKEAYKAIEDQKQFVKMASSYLDDGLDETECIELLIIDGLTREAAENYISLVKFNKEADDEVEGDDYSFYFEDSYGRVTSSSDIGIIVKAATEDAAWVKAEEALSDFGEDSSIISVNKLI